MKLLPWILLFVLSLACGVQSQLPAQPAPATFQPEKTPETATSTIFAPYSAIVSTEALNVRECPGTSCQIITQLAKGTAVTVIAEAEVADSLCWQWAKIDAGLWVCARFLR